MLTPPHTGPHLCAQALKHTCTHAHTQEQAALKAWQAQEDARRKLQQDIADKLKQERAEQLEEKHARRQLVGRGAEARGKVVITSTWPYNTLCHYFEARSTRKHAALGLAACVIPGLDRK